MKPWRGLKNSLRIGGTLASRLTMSLLLWKSKIQHHMAHVGSMKVISLSSPLSSIIVFVALIFMSMLENMITMASQHVQMMRINARNVRN